MNMSLTSLAANLDAEITHSTICPYNSIYIFESLVSLANWSKGPGINDMMDIADSYLADLGDI